MEKDGLPPYHAIDDLPVRRRRRQHRRRAVKVAVLLAVIYLVYSRLASPSSEASTLSLDRLQEDHATCSKLRSVPQDPSGPRERNARYIDGHKPVLIRNATVWVGEPSMNVTPEEAHAGKGWSWISSDVLMEYGLIKKVQADVAEAELTKDCEIIDAKGRQLTSGIVDMHSHTGMEPLPELRGGSDGNELSSDITPYVRSIDGFNPLDPQLQVIKSGGVTTSLILPGSGNNMGGEAFVIKHAVGISDGRTNISQIDMLADPERNWRYMKMACGENPKRVYGHVGKHDGPFSRMGEAWYFRHAFERATEYVKKQDDWCTAADKYGASSMQSYLPQALEWESLAAVLRGQVHVNTHCYTVADLEDYVRYTNEFKFPVRAFHHAHQTYLVPEVLKQVYGGRPPAAALFADNMYYKVESYTASEQAGKILHENGITPVYVSDNPVLNAQHVVFEAAKAFGYGLPYHAALSGVTSASAELLGLGERIGKVKPGFDADIVLWDSDPLSVGAAPVQVWIDGTAQFESPIELRKPLSKHVEMKVVSSEIADVPSQRGDVVFTGVTSILKSQLQREIGSSISSANVIISNGTIVCAGVCETELGIAVASDIRVIDLQNGYLTPSFTSIGSALGLSEIAPEEDTTDGPNGEEVFSRAIDGLSLSTKQLAAAHRHGVTKSITAPIFRGGGHKGVSVGFLTGAVEPLDKGAVWADEVAVHYTLTRAAKQGKTPSLSSAVGALRKSLLKAVEANETLSDVYSEEAYLRKVVSGGIPIILTVHSADTIAAILRVKSEVEAAIELQASSSSKPKLRMVILGGAESYIVAKELAAADVAVVVAPLQPYATEWDQRRSLTGAPLTNGTGIDALLDAGVRTAIGTMDATDDWQVRDLNLMAGIAYANGGGRLSESDAIALISTNVEAMVGLEKKDALRHFAVFEGSPLQVGSSLRALGDGQESVSIWS